MVIPSASLFVIASPSAQGRGNLSLCQPHRDCFGWLSPTLAMTREGNAEPWHPPFCRPGSRFVGTKNLTLHPSINSGQVLNLRLHPDIVGTESDLSRQGRGSSCKPCILFIINEIAAKGETGNGSISALPRLLHPPDFIGTPRSDKKRASLLRSLAGMRTHPHPSVNSGQALGPLSSRERT